MEKREILEAFASASKPADWKYCFNEKCTRKGDCLRYLATDYLPVGCDSGGAVYPSALRDGQCEYYLKPRKTRLAWGFGKLFDKVLAKDSKLIRRSLYNLVGSQKKYSRYNIGEYKLTEEQQEKFAELFRHYGYEGEPVFEHYEEAVDIGNVTRQSAKSGRSIHGFWSDNACLTVNQDMSNS